MNRILTMAAPLALLLALAPFSIGFAQTTANKPMGGQMVQTAAQQPGGKEMIAIYGHGNSKCSEYLDFTMRVGQENVAKNYQVWLNGFVSAYNTLMSTTGNVAKGKKSEELMAWMQNYCRQNPNAIFQRATIELLRVMESGEF